MNNIKDSFSIQDLELLSGIKAHTIRIWEKRYELLTPSRINRNVRVYDIQSLQKLLNISFLNSNGFKISVLSKLSEEEIIEKTKEIALVDHSNSLVVNELLIAMFSFDQNIFHKVCEKELDKISFHDFFLSSLVPLLNRVGLLWQTNVIKPTHEHFISNLIYQEIMRQTVSRTRVSYEEDEEVYVLFLPEGEIHELGLLFFNYFLIDKGYRTVYVGRSISTKDLFELNTKFKQITWVSGIIIEKTTVEKQAIVDEISQLLLDTENKCWLIGEGWDVENKCNMFVFSGLVDLINTVS